MLDKATAERRLGQGPPVLSDQRRSALAAFEASVMPTDSDEHWKYIEIGFDLDELSVAGVPTTALEPMAAGAGAVAATIIDGFVEVTGHGPSGARITTFTDIAGSDPDLFASTVKDRSVDIFQAANGAFGDDGLFIHVPRNAVIPEAIVVDIQSISEASISFPRIAVSIGENAEASVVLAFRSGDDFLAVAPIVESVVDQAGRLKMTTLQLWGKATHGIGYQRVTLGRQSSMTMGEVGLGGALGRLDLEVDLAGDGSTYGLNGLSFGDGTQVLDYRMVINHQGKNTSSDILLKGAVEDTAESVFTGLLRIEEGATNTSAFENNRNLVLSAGAKAQSVPNLEILCDDVVCGHGSTVGPLEEEHMYYLASRGIGRERAERVLVRGFFGEVIDKLPSQLVAPAIRAEVERKFVAAQVAGRLG